MADSITIVGNIASEPRRAQTATGVDVLTFRVASDQRRFDRAAGKWIDGEPNWFTVSAYRALAVHAETSLRKGERVIVQGRLRLRAWTDGDRRGTAAEIDADALGHDLRWGTTSYTRIAQTGAGAEPDSRDEFGEANGADEFANSTSPGELVDAATPF